MRIPLMVSAAVALAAPAVAAAQVNRGATIVTKSIYGIESPMMAVAGTRVTMVWQGARRRTTS